ncbi:hypothetical protein [Flavihumibacter solisilvae]|uniref:Uncharacterized protein n=1 Tax=Flavihumibacter solisilvae TaxID=1349421 RepID=A0A0C1LBM4_9BACT|nr:hypothetical protein [Flavihumibacter solisilvae]KIC92923.1 hypothetical protein OI18_20185 [Flavihumibacter solisilvae]
MTAMQPDKLVSRIFELWEDDKSDENWVLERIQREFNLSIEEAESALELTKTGCFRAQLIFAGKKYPRNNLCDNPILISAIKIALIKSGRPKLGEKQSKPWWKF